MNDVEIIRKDGGILVRYIPGGTEPVQIFKSLDPTWPRWAVVCPGLNTAWAKSEQDALNMANSLVLPIG